jgi:hypothetical protein
LTTLTVGQGAARQAVTAWAVVHIAGTPFPVWTDAKGNVFALVGGLTTIRAGYEDAQPALEKAQDMALAARSPILAQKLVTVPSKPVVFVDVRAFVDGVRFAEHQTVVVDRVHGHLPAKMRTKQAIDAGYDEITHIYLVAMQAMPDDVVDHSNGIQRFQGIGRYAKDMDLDAEPMKSPIATMAQRRIAVDPTLVVVEGLFVRENGDLSPACAPFVGTLPPLSNAASGKADSNRKVAPPAPIFGRASISSRNSSAACTKPACPSLPAPTDRGWSWYANSHSMSSPASPRRTP